MNATQGQRAEMIAEAYGKVRMARKAMDAGDDALAIAYLQQARDRYRQCGLTGMVGWCDRWIAPVIG